MNNQCVDRDLLALEPVIYTGGGCESQQLAAGQDGAIAGTDFTSDGADFEACGIAAGMVLCVVGAAPAETRAYEIIERAGDTSLTVSVLRAHTDDPPLPPPPGTELNYFVLSFRPQIAAAADSLRMKLGQLIEAGGVDAAAFEQSPDFCQAVAMAALSSIFAARAASADKTDLNWAKAELYRQRHQALLAGVRLAQDLDGDGYAEHTRTLGHIRLRRA